jgi:endonuclease YncB( thermonuclease family)
MRTLLLLLLACAISACTAGAQEQSSPADFVASSQGQVYYWIGCDNWKSLAPQNLLWFPSAERAEAAGYRPSTARGCTRPHAADTLRASAIGRCTVARIIDGDTLVCKEGEERIRLLLIDAPEMQHGEFGARARGALEQLLPPGTPARIELDVQRADRYGRTLAYLYDPTGRMINAELARLGYALVSIYPPNVRHVEEIREAIEEARQGRRGLWQGSAFECPPAEFRAGRCK